MLSQGNDLRTVMEVRAHSQVSLTANTYGHVIRALKKEAAARMGDVLWGAE